MEYFLPILRQVLGFTVVALLLCLVLWVPARILRKAGFSWGFALLGLVLGPIALLIFAFYDWPIERELAWLKLKGGEPPGRLWGLAEGHAAALERNGEWKQAAQVYRELISKAGPDENASYYRNCLSRLEERAGESLEEWEAE
jgi:hypothetical protein